MDSTQAIERMLQAEGTSAYAVAHSMGRAHSYVSGMLRRGSDPSTGIMASIAHACGYTLQLVGHGETITLDRKTSLLDEGVSERGEGDHADD